MAIELSSSSKDVLDETYFPPPLKSEERGSRRSLLLRLDEDRFVQVEFPLDAPQHRIIDAAFVAQTDRRVALHS